MSLNPPWNRIFRGENVTLTCNKNKPLKGNSTEWTYNNTTLEVTTSSLNITNASHRSSGEYRCRNNDLNLSEAVHLEVFSGKFQGYANIDSSMRWMGHMKMRRKKVISRLRVPRWDTGSLTQDLFISFFHIYSFWLLSIFWPPPNVIPLLYFTSDCLFDIGVYRMVKWHVGYVNFVKSCVSETGSRSLI